MSTQSECKPNKDTESGSQPKDDKKLVVVKKGPKDWDKIVKELEEEDKEVEEDSEDLFKKLYSSADDDTRRAMNKSYIESKGTTLSMNWKSVGKKFVKPYDEKGDEGGSDSEPDPDIDDRTVRFQKQ